MNIFKFEFKTYIKSILIWTLSISAGFILYMAFFPAIQTEADAFNELMSSFPKEMLAIFGMNTDLPVTSMLGYLGLTYSFMIIPVAIQASNYGFHMLSVEERELTADFLMAKPVKRSKILISKFAAALLALSFTYFALWGSAALSVTLFKGDEIVELSKVNTLMSLVILFQLTFVSIGMVVSVMLKKIPSVLSFSMALGFGTFILNAFKNALSSDLFGYLSPYSYYDYTSILVSGDIELLGLIISLSVIVVSLTATYFLYNKRNISSL